MGVFTFQLSKEIAKINRTYKNDYNKSVATLVIDGVEYVENEYSKALANYVKYKSQYDQLARKKKEAESTIAYSKLAISIIKDYHEDNKDIDNKKKSADLVSVEADKRAIADAEDTLKEVTSSMAKLERKYNGVKAILNDYGKHGEQIIEEGVATAKNVKLLVSDEQFCRYLMMHEFENVKITAAEDVPKADALLYENIIKLSADFNAIIPKLIGREQSRRAVQIGVNPLDLILINGKRLAEYAFTNTAYQRPKVDNKEVSYEDMASNATGAAFMKARFMAALVANRDDIRILTINNAENHYEISHPFKISVDMSDYKEVEEAWLIENKKNVITTKKNICQFTGSKNNLTDEELEEKAKNESGYKKKGLDKDQKEQFVKDYVAKAKENQAKTYKSDTKESIKLINKKYSTKVDDLTKKKTKEELEADAKRDKLSTEFREMFSEKAAADITGYGTAIKESRSIAIQPIDERTKNFINDVVVLRQSARLKYDPSKTFEILTKKVTDEYYATKEEAERCLKIYGLVKTYDLLKTRVSSVFKISNFLSDYREASKNIEKDLDNTAVLTFNINMYVRGVTNLIGGVSKMVTEMTHLRKGSYLTLGNEIAYVEKKGDENSFLDGSILAPEERKEYFALLTKFKEVEDNVRERIEKVLEFHKGLGHRSTTDFIDVYNAMKKDIDIDQLEMDITRFSDLTGKLLYESNGEKFPDDLLESKHYGREVDRLIYIDEAKKAKDNAISRLRYLKDVLINNQNILTAAVVFDSMDAGLIKAKKAQDAKIAIINAKKADEVTDEEREFIKSSISANYAKLTEIENDLPKVSHLFYEHRMNDSKLEDTDVIEDALIAQFPQFYDEESVKAEYANRPVQEENKNVINEAPEFTDEDFERVMNRVAASGIQTFSSEKGNLQFQKRLDDAVEHYVKVMTESEKKDLQKTVNACFMTHVPAELKVEFGKTDFFNNKIGGAALERADAVYKAEINKLEGERKTAKDTVSQLNIEVSRAAYLVENQGEEVAYWEGREKLIDEMVYISDEFKELNSQYEALLEENKKLNEHMARVIKTSANLASELFDMDNILNPKSGWSSKITMGDLKKRVYPKKLLKVDELVLDGPDKEAEKTRLNIFNVNREFKPADSFEQSMQIAGVKKDHHREAGNFKDYDKLTIDQFISLYFRVRSDYPQEETFVAQNPYLQARMKSIMRFYDNVDAEREFRKKAYDMVNGMRIDRYSQLVTNDGNMTVIGQKQYALSNQLSEKFFQYERKGDVIIDRDFMDDTFANLDDFLGKAARIKAKILERKDNATKKYADLKDNLKAKENELISWTKKSEELAKAATCEYKRNAVEKLVADYEKIKKQSVNNYVIDKILTKRKAELSKKDEPKVVVQDTVKDYQTRYENMKAKYYSDLGRFTVNEGGKVYKEIASRVRSEVFAKNMSVLYKLSEDKDKFNNPGHELDDMKLINDRRIMASKLYVNVVKELSKSDILGKNYNFESDYAKLKDTIKNRYKLYTTGDKSTQNIKNFMAKIKKPTLDNLYDGVYPYVFKYVTSYNKLKDFLVAEVIGKNKYEPDAAVKEIAQFEKDAKLYEGTKKNYETFKKLLSECPENDRKEILMTIMARKEPKFNNDDLKCVDKLCRDIADEEIRAQVGIVNQSLALNMDLIDKKSAEFSKAELIKLQQQQEKELKKLMEQADKEREKQLKESQKQAEAQKNGPHK